MVVNVGNQSKWRWAAIHNHWIVKKRLDFMACFVVNYNKIIYNNPVAQLVEQHPFKVMVVGSIPTGITMLLQIVTIYFTKTLDLYGFLSLYLSV